MCASTYIHTYTHTHTSTHTSTLHAAIYKNGREGLVFPTLGWVGLLVSNKNQFMERRSPLGFSSNHHRIEKGIK